MKGDKVLMAMIAAFLVALAIPVVVAAAPSGSAAFVSGCSRGQLEVNYSGISVRNMKCATARRLIGSLRRAPGARFTVQGWGCRRLSGGLYGGTFRCTRGNAAFRFGWGD